jgi:hypothetical protein
MRRRSLAVLVLLWLPAACGPEAFAEVVLRVREPALDTPRRAQGNTNVLFRFADEEATAHVSFPPGELFATPPPPRGGSPRTLFAGVSVGNPEAPVALGFAEPIDIPDTGSLPDDGRTFRRAASLVLARANVVELLDKQRPTPRTAPALCMDPSGKGWFIGGFGVGGQGFVEDGLENGYTFGLEDLQARDVTLTTLLRGQMACDSDGGGSFVLVESRCNEAGTAQAGGARLSRGQDGQDATADILAGCNPSLSVRDGTAWVVSDGFVEAFSASTLEPLAEAFAFAGSHGSIVALSANQALVAAFGAPDATQVFTLASGVITAVAGPALTAVDFARARDGGTYVVDPNGLVLLVSATGATNGRSVALGDAAPARALEILPDGRAVILTGTTIVVEGGPHVPHPGRERMGVTVGGAVVLVGGPRQGTDVLVPEPLRVSSPDAG